MSDEATDRPTFAERVIDSLTDCANRLELGKSIDDDDEFNVCEWLPSNRDQNRESLMRRVRMWP